MDVIGVHFSQKWRIYGNKHVPFLVNDGDIEFYRRDAGFINFGKASNCSREGYAETHRYFMETF